MQDTKLRRWPYVVNGLMVLLVLGIVYAWSIFVVPLETEFGWLRAQTSIIFTISMVCFCTGAIVSGFITTKIGPRVTMAISALMLFSGFFLATRIRALTGLCVFYGVFCGLGSGMSYNAVISTVNMWFPDRRGLVSGLMLMGFGFSSVIFSSLISHLLANNNWRVVFIIIGSIAAAIIILGTFLMKRPGRDVSLPQPKNVAITASRDFTPLQMLKTKSFWTFGLATLLPGAAALAVVGNAALLSLDISTNAGLSTSAITALSALSVSAFSLGNGFGRLVVGYILDRLGRRKTLSGDLALAFVSLAVIVLSYKISSPYLFIAATVVFAFTYGGITTTLPTTAIEFFGSSHYPINYAIINLGGIFCSILGPAVVGKLHDLSPSESYLPSLVLLMVYVAAGFIISSAVKKPE